MSPRPRPRLALSLTLVSALALTGCEELLEQLKAEEVVIATLVATPDLPSPADPQVTVKGQTAVTAFFGRVDQTKLVPTGNGARTAQEGAFTQVAGAEMTLEFDPAEGEPVQVALTDAGGGRYTVTSLQNERLVYEPEIAYTLVVKFSGKTHRLRATAPRQTRIANFVEAEQPLLVQEAGTNLEVRRSPALGIENPIAFVSLATVAGDTSEEAWTTAPKSALGFLQLVLDPTPFKKDVEVIPGTRFAASSSYLLTLTAFAKGEQVTDDGSNPLFAGSSFLVGTADGGGVQVQ